MPRCTLWIFGALVVLAVASPAAHAQPTITSVTPFSVRVGEATDVTLVGDKLAGALQITTTFGGPVEIVSQEAQRVVCRITLPADFAPQVAALIACTPEGATDPVLLLADDLPSIADNGANHQVASAQEIPFGCGVNGMADGTESDYYRVSLQEGQRLSVEALAARWGSGCDPVVRLLDSGGQELVAVDDIEGLGGDCHLEFEAKQAADVLVEIRDNKYQSAVAYHLRVGDFPLAQIAYPIAVQRGTTATVAFLTKHPDISFGSIVHQVNDPWLPRIAAGARSDSASHSFSQIVNSPFAQYLEAEPNNDATNATAIPVPCAVNGIIEDPGDRDLYSFAAKSGQHYAFRTIARSAGSPALPFLRILNSAGEALAESAYGDADEVSLSFAAPADGVYQLHVDELTGRGGPLYSYHVEISDTPLRLSLKNAPDVPIRTATSTTDGAIAIDLACERFGYSGSIQLSIEPSVAGIELFQPEIPVDATEHRLFLAFNDRMPVGSLQMLRVVGRVNDMGNEHAVAASTSFHLRTRWPMMASPPGALQNVLLVSATPPASPIITPVVNTAHLFIPRTGGTAQAVCTVTRSNAEYKDPVTFVSGSLPAGIAAKAAVEGDQFTISITSDATEFAETHTIPLGLFGAFSGRSQIARIPLTVEINDPLSISAEQLEIKPGTSAKVRVLLVRRGSERHPVTVTFTNLPAGISIAETTAAADQDVVEIEVIAAPEAAAGTYDNIQLVANSQYAGQATTAAGTMKITVPAPQ